MLVPLVSFIGKFIAEIFNRMPEKSSLKRKFLLITGTVFSLWLVVGGITQWVRYCYTAPFHLEESRHNSYGCKEAGEYLSQISDIKDYSIITDVRMTVDVYLNYYLLNKGKIDRYYSLRSYQSGEEKRERFYVLWAPESHSHNYWGGLFRHLHDFFRRKHPDATPLKTVYYPNGVAAIHIFKVKDDIEGVSEGVRVRSLILTNINERDNESRYFLTRIRCI